MRPEGGAEGGVRVEEPARPSFLGPLPERCRLLAHMGKHFMRPQRGQRPGCKKKFVWLVSKQRVACPRAGDVQHADGRVRARGTAARGGEPPGRHARGGRAAQHRDLQHPAARLLRQRRQPLAGAAHPLLPSHFPGRKDGVCPAVPLPLFSPPEPLSRVRNLFPRLMQPTSVVKQALVTENACGLLRLSREKDDRGCAWGLQDSLVLLRRMGAAGVAPSTDTFNTLMAACLARGEPAAVPRLFRRLLGLGHAPDALSYTSLIAALTRLGRPLDAVRPPLLPSPSHNNRTLLACGHGSRTGIFFQVSRLFGMCQKPAMFVGCQPFASDLRGRRRLPGGCGLMRLPAHARRWRRSRRWRRTGAWPWIWPR